MAPKSTAAAESAQASGRTEPLEPGERLRQTSTREAIATSVATSAIHRAGALSGKMLLAPHNIEKCAIQIVKARAAPFQSTGSVNGPRTRQPPVTSRASSDVAMPCSATYPMKRVTISSVTLDGPESRPRPLR